MDTRDWLVDTRESYDTVAGGYADFVRDALGREPLLRGVLGLFAESVRAGGGPVVDVGCGPGFVPAHLRDLGLDVFGIDLSPGMIEIARELHPDIGFAVGSMTELPVAGGSVGGVLAFFSVIHVPDVDVPTVLAHFHRVLRPGGVVLLGFHLGDRNRLKTDGYGGHPMRVHVYRRPMTRMAAWSRDAGLTVEAEIVLQPETETPAGMLVARRPDRRDGPA